MNKIYLLLFLCLSAFSAFAQNDNRQSDNSAIDPRITEVFGNQIGLILSEPQRLKDLNALLFERYEILNAPIEKDEKFVKLSEVPLFNIYNSDLKRDVVFNKETFNILKYDMRFFAKTDIVYRIDNTDFLIVIHPQNLRK